MNLDRNNSERQEKPGKYEIGESGLEGTEDNLEKGTTPKRESENKTYKHKKLREGEPRVKERGRENCKRGKT